MRYIDGIDRNRKIRFPEYIDDFINEENPVRIIDQFVKSLDMKELGFEKAEPSNKGRMPYDPRDLLKLYMYGYMNRIQSSRRLENEAGRNIEVMWLLRKLKPDAKTISNFRKDNKEGIKNVYKSLIKLCKQWDLFGNEVIAVDGSKFRASNSKKNNFNEKKLNRKIKYIEESIDKYEMTADKNDNEETNSRKLTKEEIKQRIAELKTRKNQYVRYKKQMEETGITEISTVDPDSRLMGVNNNGIDVCYNVQTVVDSKYNLIVDYDVINNPTDQGQLSKMSTKAKEVFEVESVKVLADKGYYNAEDLKECESKNIITYIAKQTFANSTGERAFYGDKFIYNKEDNIYLCPMGQTLKCVRKKLIDENTKTLNYKNKNACITCINKSKCTENKNGRTISRSIDQDFLDIVDKRKEENKELYRKRQNIVEHPFANTKRNFTFIQFLTRGLQSVKTEISLTFLGYNLKRIIKIVGGNEVNRRLRMV